MDKDEILIANDHKVTFNATHHETTTQPSGLLALAIKVLERNKNNTIRNYSATSQLHHTETNATKRKLTLIKGGKND